ncbi:MAG: hypothetical protein K2K47_04130 [Duncaniella sp.]|nr:hypothetical protein [Duncaniella sp.]
MHEFFWMIFGWILKGVGYFSLAMLVVFFFRFLWVMTTNGGRKWYYYEPNKPWKGGYWTPLLPDHPPYNEYEWNPVTCRFEHKITHEPLHPWEKPKNPVREKKSEWDWDALGLPDDDQVDDIYMEN